MENGSKDKTNERQLAGMSCRLLKCLCQIDADCVSNDQGRMIMYKIFQWLRDDDEIHIRKIGR